MKRDPLKDNLTMEELETVEELGAASDFIDGLNKGLDTGIKVAAIIGLIGLT